MWPAATEPGLRWYFQSLRNKKEAFASARLHRDGNWKNIEEMSAASAQR